MSRPRAKPSRATLLLAGSADPGTASTITNNQVANPAQEGADTRTWDRIDGANNWTRVVGSGVPSRTMTANEVNEYTAVDSVSRSHDDNGNLVNDGTNSYFFDAFNRLVRVRRNSDGLDLAFYAYDAEGRRTRRHVQNSGSLNTTVTYFYLGGSVVEEGDASGVPQRQYVWGERLLQYKVGSATVYCHENGYGSIAKTTLEASETFDERDYNAYGEFVQGGIDTGLPYAFRGWRFDGETAYLLPIEDSRYYTAALGRLTSRGVGHLQNDYAFENNNSLIVCDYGSDTGRCQGKCTVEEWSVVTYDADEEFVLIDFLDPQGNRMGPGGGLVNLRGRVSPETADQIRRKVDSYARGLRRERGCKNFCRCGSLRARERLAGGMVRQDWISVATRQVEQHSIIQRTFEVDVSLAKTDYDGVCEEGLQVEVGRPGAGTRPTNPPPAPPPRPGSPLPPAPRSKWPDDLMPQGRGGGGGDRRWF